MSRPEARQGDVPGVQLRCSTVVAAPAAEARRLIERPAEWGSWLEAQVEEFAKDATRFRLRWRDHSGQEIEEIVSEFDLVESRGWTARVQRAGGQWDGVTRISIRVVDQGEACEVSIFEDGFAHLPLSRGLTVWEWSRRRWRQALARLAEELAVEPRLE